MTLFQKLEECIWGGYEIKFERDLGQLNISIREENNKDGFWDQTSALPLSDHFYEVKVVDCIDYMIKKIENE